VPELKKGAKLNQEAGFRCAGADAIFGVLVYLYGMPEILIKAVFP
jgi:hypothetical protein